MDATKREILMNLLDKIAEEQKYADCKIEVKDINYGGTNITAALFLATLSAEGKDDLNLFVKVASMSDAMRKASPMLCPFTTELYFYKNVMKQFERVQEKHGIPEEHRLTFPKIYGCHDEYLNEIIILENLMKEGFECQDRLKSVDLEYVSKAIGVMTKFHALSLAYREEEPEEFEAAIKTLTLDPSKMLAITDILRPKALAGVYEAAAEEYIEKLKKYLEPAEASDPFIDFVNSYHRAKSYVLLHGDFKASNVLHRRHNGELQMIPVDFQIVHVGSPVSELMYFLFTATDDQFRRQHYHEVLDLYYEQLKLALERLNVDLEKAYSEMTYREELKEGEMTGLMIGALLLPMVMVAEESVPAFTEAAKIDDFLVPASELYKDRFNGILRNYVEWGLL